MVRLRRSVSTVCLLVATTLGAQEVATGPADLAGCARAAAKVSITEGEVAGGALHARGTWSVTDAIGVMLELKLQSDRYQDEIRFGLEGTFDLAQEYIHCGRVGLRMVAYPVIGTRERALVCLGRETWARLNLDQPCLPIPELACDWRPEGEAWVGACRGSARGRALPSAVAPSWAVDEGELLPADGVAGAPWRREVRCRRLQTVSLSLVDPTTGIRSPPGRVPCGVDDTAGQVVPAHP